MAKSFVFGALVKYSGIQFVTRLLCEYEHTGEQFYTKKRGEHHRTVTNSPEIAELWKEKGYKVTKEPGSFYVKRLAIPTVTASGATDWWYINNPGDSYDVLRISKFGRKIHSELSKPRK